MRVDRGWAKSIFLTLRRTWMLVTTGILCHVKASWRWESCLCYHVRGALKVSMTEWMKKVINTLPPLQVQCLVHLGMNEGQLSLTPPVTPRKFTFHQQNQSQKKVWAAAHSIILWVRDQLDVCSKFQYTCGAHNRRCLFTTMTLNFNIILKNCWKQWNFIRRGPPIQRRMQTLWKQRFWGFAYHCISST